MVLIMEEFILKYKQKKYLKCLELLNALPGTDDIVQNFLIDNCRLVCESMIRIAENDQEKLYEIQEQHYLLFERVILSNTCSDSIPLQLKLIITFNFIFWLSMYNDKDFDDSEAEEYLKLLLKGLSSVSAKQVSLENASTVLDKVICGLHGLRDLLLNEDYSTTLLIVELFVVVIIFIIKLNYASVSKCLPLVNLIIEESGNAITSSKSVNDFYQVKPMINMCKFSLCGTGTVFANLDSDVIDCLYILQSVLLYLSEDFKGSLKSLQSNVSSNMKSLWHYLVILNGFQLENWELCTGFLSRMSGLIIEKNLKARFHIMQGKINYIERNYKEALEQFKKALELCPHAPLTYSYIAQLYGKMGLLDFMLENFEKLVQMLDAEEPEGDFEVNFETSLLSWIHPADEVTEVESFYGLAVSYGLNEDFKSACDAFERVLCLWDEVQPRGRKRIIELPNSVTVFHEAAVMNLLSGNLVRAEQIIRDAIDQYVPEEFHSQQHNLRTSLLCKDLGWLQRLIQCELLEADLEPKQLSSESLYSEDLIFILPQNVIGHLILSEIQRKQGIEDYKTTLSTVFSIFSKYLASCNNREGVDENEKHFQTLVKALTGKTCIRIAEIQMELLDHSNSEKMLKRALSCNRADKDALYQYYNFLVQLGRKREALKLWNTFSKEPESFSVDSLQSFSLRHILIDKISKQELWKIQEEIESSNITLS